MKKSTLCFCCTDSEILLGMKKQGFGSGKWNGFGGKVKEDEGETVIIAAIRELIEESGVVVTENNMEQVGIIDFYIGGKEIFECAIFLVTTWEGAPKETDEMKPQWFLRDAIPYDQMWAADKLWLPLILEGKKIRAEVRFGADGTTIEHFSSKTCVKSFFEV